MPADYKDIIKELNRSIRDFNRSIPDTQREMLKEIERELRRLDLNGDNIKVTVKNLSIINSIRNKMNRIILSDAYKNDVKDFLKAFNTVTSLQNEYWKSVESSFTPRPLLKEIKTQAMFETAAALTEAGITVNVSGRIVDILRANITTGGSYAKLTQQLRQGILDTKTPGFLNRYATQITTDAINQYSANYNQIVSSDLSYEWYVYDNTDILTTRCFCDAMTDQPYFHLSEIPRLLKGQGLKCAGNPVAINEKTNLPNGMYPGTNADNFLIRRGGYNCRHQCRPMNERFIPLDVRERVFATPAYQNWKLIHQ
jgi:hypothetical protein